MPHFLYKSISRKTFIERSVKAAGFALLPDLGFKVHILNTRAEVVNFALLSDTHIAADTEDNYRGFYPSKNLKEVVSDVINYKPEATIINGDIARLTGEVADYKNVKHVLEPVGENFPVYLTLGNHDHRENIQQAFSLTSEMTKQQVMVVETKPLRFLLLDSLMYVDKVAGLLGKDQRLWLDKTLNSSDSKPTVLFLHHTLGDGDGDLLDVDRLFSIIKPHKKVKAIFYGHSHEYKYDTLNGIHLINQPATGYNFSDKEPIGWLKGKFSKIGADLTLKAIGGDKQKDGVTTSLKWR